MRQPTPLSNLLRWHRDALAGKRPPIHENDPQMGWFKVRMVRGGPFVPARIWIDREICPLTGELACDERFLCEIDGERRDVQREWVWLSKNPISKAEYDELCSLRQSIEGMAATHAPFDLQEHVIRP
jgi:hypothetical protein